MNAAEKLHWYKRRIARLEREERDAKRTRDKRVNGYEKRSAMRLGQIAELRKRIEKILGAGK